MRARRIEDGFDGFGTKLYPTITDDDDVVDSARVYLALDLTLDSSNVQSQSTNS
jgi:hypothetical protein